MNTKECHVVRNTTHENLDTEQLEIRLCYITYQIWWTANVESLTKLWMV